MQIADLRLTKEEIRTLLDGHRHYPPATLQLLDAQLAKAAWKIMEWIHSAPVKGICCESTQGDFTFNNRELTQEQLALDLQDILNAAGIPWPQEAQRANS